MIGDFHLHSNRSDGRLSPAALIDLVADAGVHVVALTDHDTTAGVHEAASKARERGLTFVPGIEMTTYGCERVVHVLGLGIDPEHADIHKANRIATGVWDANQCRWIEAIAKKKVNVSVDRDFADHPVRLPVLIERLCLRGFADGDPKQAHAAFRAYFDALPADAYAALASPAQAATIIRRAAGVAIVAHPYGLLEDKLIEWVLADMDGAEALYLPYTDAQRAKLRAVVERCTKLISCGSDYHGYFTTEYRRPPWDAPDALVQRLQV
ncbi:MAG: PHP domain-containing protein, partial [Candidatus Eremiobacteraeota bacterium]|nr:PHP domain-containing protein [Candidatus Eremiobacteraeota bacterium]